eukprot:12880492-Prorocentrum_lima.AAC.1
MCIRDSPPALCTAVLRGIAAQHAREGQAIPPHVRRRLDDGRALYDLEEGPQEEAEAVPEADYEDARIVDSDAQSWGHPDGCVPRGYGDQEGSPYRDATTGAALSPELVEAARAEEIRIMQSWQ